MPAVAQKAWTYIRTHTWCSKGASVKNEKIPQSNALLHHTIGATKYKCLESCYPNTHVEKIRLPKWKCAINLQTQTPPILLFQCSIAETKIAGAKSPLHAQLPTHYVRALRVYQKYRICASPDVVKMCEAGGNSPPQTKRTKTSPQVNTNTLLSFTLECCAV